MNSNGNNNNNNNNNDNNNNNNMAELGRPPPCTAAPGPPRMT